MRTLIHQLKFSGRRGISRLLGALAVYSHRDYITEHQFLVPVPLTGERKMERGYNQALLLSREIRAHAGERGPLLLDILRRAGGSPPQSGMHSIGERVRNMKDRFSLRRGAVSLIKGKRVLLVDDVLISGATASACARALQNGGAARVDLLTIARTMRFSRAESDRNTPV
jgi:ComF family protein